MLLVVTGLDSSHLQNWTQLLSLIAQPHVASPQGTLLPELPYPPFPVHTFVGDSESLFEFPSFCVSSKPLENQFSKKQKPCSAVSAGFRGINTPAVADFQLPVA